jgi:hypothetical protein
MNKKLGVRAGVDPHRSRYASASPPALSESTVVAAVVDLHFKTRSRYDSTPRQISANGATLLSRLGPFSVPNQTFGL